MMQPAEKIETEKKSPPRTGIWKLESVPAYAALASFYGVPGSGLVTVNLPYPLRLSWDIAARVTKTQCHKRVAKSFLSVMEAVRAEYGSSVCELGLDLYGGGFANRPQRGGTKLSVHAWGAAFDFDPDHNQLRMDHDEARFADQDYDAWWALWEEAGWVSLGRTKDYDWMHVQACR
ncbi:MAG: hypothetical protein WCG19_05360 [Chlorobiaceae bacterium]